MSSSEQRFSTDDVTGGMDSDSVRETIATSAEKVRPQVRKLQPHLLEHSRSGTMAAATGALSVLRALRTLRRGRWGRGLFQLTFGLLWVGVALTQRRGARDQVTESDIVSTSAGDFDAVETGREESGVEHGEDVGDAIDTGTGVDEIKTGTDESVEREGESGGTEFDESEVVDTGTPVEDAESREREEAATDEADEAAATESDKDEETAATESDEDAERED